MKIGFYLTHMDRSDGIRRYNRDLIYGISRLPFDKKIYLWTTWGERKTLQKSFGQTPHVQYAGQFPRPSLLGGASRRVIAKWNGLLLKKNVDRWGIDVIHFPDPNHIPTPHKGMEKLVCTIHDLLPADPMSPDFSARTKRIFQYNLNNIMTYSRLVFVPSRFVKQELLQRFPRHEKQVQVTHEGASGKFRPNSIDWNLLKTYGLKEGAPFFLYIGYFVSRRNLLKLLEAFSMLPKKLRNSFRLVFLGGGWLTSNIYQKAQELKIFEQFIHIKGVLDEHLVHLYNAAFALTYVSLSEGFGLPLLEAMQCGCPVITSNCSCMPEIAGDAALLVDPYNVESIRDGMLQLIEKPDLRRSLIQKGFERAKEFSWEKMAKETYEGYKAVIAGKV